MKFIFSLIFLMAVLTGCQNKDNSISLITPFELSDSTETATYTNGMNWWESLQHTSEYVHIIEFGNTDVGIPLNIIALSASKIFNISEIKSNDKTIWLINNGIHPGEPDGIDASMLFARNLVSSSDFKEKYKDIVVLIIPFYNIGGALNRNCCSRTNYCTN